ncbi:MAG TPA: peroxidase family protein [Chthoniobacterales bacterium]|jgi:hypothetical protein
MPFAYPCAPVPETVEGHYGRLCPGEWLPFDEDMLRELAQRMRDSPEKRLARARPLEGLTRLPSGYVYFGQFIDHDLTRDGRALADAGPDVEATPNYRTSKLDLDHLYGKTPAAVPCLYERDGESLRVGLTREATTLTGQTLPASLDDLRRTNGVPLIIDPRSDENLFAAQLHVLFAKFHNQVLELLKEQPALSPGPIGGSLFDQARRFVTWQYQWLILYDFLPRIVRLNVLQRVEQNRFRLFARSCSPADSPFALPVEFTTAAFRFGHSMVRGSYILNDHGPQNLDTIIRMTKRGGGITERLPAQYVIDWSRFVGANPGRVNRARFIDTHLTEQLYTVHCPTARGVRWQDEGRAARTGNRDALVPPLPELTLRRASKVRLPSSQECISHFGLPVTVQGDNIAPPEDMAFFRSAGLAERTPLWYYILREAATEPNPEPGFGPYPPRQKLGTLGSLIVSEVTYQVLNSDSDSIRHAGRTWQPPTFRFGHPSRLWSLRSLGEVAAFVADASRAPDRCL